MFRRPALALCLGLACVVVASAAPPEVKAPEKVSGEVGAFIPLRTETTGKFTRFYPLDKGLNVFPADLLTDKKTSVVSASKAGTYRVLAFSGNADGPSEPILIVVTVGTPAPGPTPEPEPGPTPTPTPATTFKVIMVYESTALHSPAQKSVLEGRVVEDYLTAKCTGGKSGWIRRDKDVDPATDTTAFKDLWAAAKPKITKTPCVVIAADRNVTIESLGSNPTEMIKVLDKYREGK